MATTAEDLQTTTPVVTLTPEAHKIVRDAIAQEPEPATLALWLEVRGVEAGSFIYDLYFQAVADAGDGDASHTQDELVVVIPEASIDRLRGARLEWSEDDGGGLVLINPNSPTPEEASPGVPLKFWPRASRVRWRCASSPCSSRPSILPSHPTAAGRTWSR